MSKKAMLVTGMLIAGLSWAAGQDTILRVKDTVRLPSKKPQEAGKMVDLSFDENWYVYPDRGALYKDVVSYQAWVDHTATDFWGGEPYRGTITHEYFLRDPETGTATAALGPVSRLVANHSSLADHYNLAEQLFSVLFREQWVYEPQAGKLSKKVLDITPVIWQRRQTDEGVPVNDGESGLPVYYRLEGEKIGLRNP